MLTLFPSPMKNGPKIKKVGELFSTSDFLLTKWSFTS
jgi:hypothetical protein